MIMVAGSTERETAGGHNLFGQDAAGYQAGRPGYPDALFHILIGRLRLDQRSSVLEIGPGTGQATRELLGLGVGSLTAVEPDPHLARHLTDGLERERDDGRLRVIQSRFESAPLDPASFDAAIAASSFHWVDPQVGLARVKALLKPRGHFGLWWNIFHDMSGATPWSSAIRPFFASLTMPPSFVGDSHYSLDVDARVAELEAAGFTDVEHMMFRQPIVLTAARVRAFYASFSPVLRLPPAERSAWLDEISGLVDREFGGSIEHEVLTSLFTCRAI